MVIDVRPRASYSSARAMRVSVRGVDGRGGLVEQEARGVGDVGRARATSWRSPTDRCSPRCPTWVSSPSRQRVEPVVEAELAEGQPHVVLVGARLAEAHVLDDRGLEQEALLGHQHERAAATRARRRAGRCRRRGPRPRWGRPGGRAAWRASTCPSRSRRRWRPARRPIVNDDVDAAPARRPRACAGRAVAERHGRRRSRAGRWAAPRRRSGRRSSIGVSSTSSTLRQPATAVWVWSRISVNSAIGSRNGRTRNRKPTISPAVSPDAGPERDAGDDDGGDGEDARRPRWPGTGRRRGDRPGS